MHVYMKDFVNNLEASHLQKFYYFEAENYTTASPTYSLPKSIPLCILLGSFRMASRHHFVCATITLMENRLCSFLATFEASPSSTHLCVQVLSVHKLQTTDFKYMTF